MVVGLSTDVLLVDPERVSPNNETIDELSIEEEVLADSSTVETDEIILAPSVALAEADSVILAPVAVLTLGESTVLVLFSKRLILESRLRAIVP